MDDYFKRTGDVRIGEFEITGVKCKDRTCTKQLTCTLSIWRKVGEFMPMVHPVMTRDREVPLAVYAVCESFEKGESNANGEEESKEEEETETAASTDAARA